MNSKYWDRAWGLIDGCTPCSPGCDNCWSAAMAYRFKPENNWQYEDDCGMPDLTHFDKPVFTGKIVLHPYRLEVPLKRKKPTVWAIWNDLFHEDVPLDFIDSALDVIAACPQHTFLVLTKRAHLIEEKLYDTTPENGIRPLGGGDYLGNLWVGITVCNQEEADEKIPMLLKAWPGKKWISIEPMLGEIDFKRSLNPGQSFFDAVTNVCSWILKETLPKVTYRGAGAIDAVVLGGETGPHARPMHPDWARSVRDQCEAAGVPFFLKYLNKKDGRVLDGREHNDLPWRMTH